MAFSSSDELLMGLGCMKDSTFRIFIRGTALVQASPWQQEARAPLPLKAVVAHRHQRFTCMYSSGYLSIIGGSGRLSKAVPSEIWYY